MLSLLCCTHYSVECWLLSHFFSAENMSNIKLVSGTPFWVFPVGSFMFWVLTWISILSRRGEMVGPINIVKRRGGIHKIASHCYFACLDKTHSDCTVKLIRFLGNFQRIKDGRWHIMTNKQLDSGGLSFFDKELIYLDLTPIGTR